MRALPGRLPEGSVEPSLPAASSMDSPTPSHRFSVLGSIELTRQDGTVVRSVLAQPKRVALLAYLAVAGKDHPVTRDSVVGVFWPDTTEERALNSLRQAIHFLRRSLGTEVIERPGDHLLVIPGGELACDAVDFESLVNAGSHEEATRLYRGPFLDGLPMDGPYALDEWIEARRREYRRGAIDSAAALAQSALEHGQSVSAADWARRLLQLDPLEEQGISLLVEAHVMDGDAVSAIRAYRGYEARLKRELDLAPSDDLQDRIASLRGDPPPAIANAPAATSSADPVSEVAESSDDPPHGASDGPSGAASGSRLEASPEGTDAGATSPEGPVEAIRPTGARGLLAGAVVVAALLVGAWLSSVWTGDTGQEEDPPMLSGRSTDRPSVAVLPFTTLGGDSTGAFFVAGVHESVIVTLSKIGALDVSGLQAVRPYANTTSSHREIAEELGVSALMSGSVQRSEDRLRIIVELVDARTGTQIWSEAFDRRLDDVFAVQSDIATSVAASLSAALTPREVHRISRRPTESTEALDAYMKGREAYLRLTPDGMDEAIRFFESAVEADSSFAAAWTGIADALLQRVQFFGYPSSWADSAMSLVERAISLDPELPEAYRALGFVHSVYGREAAALEASRRALDLRPGYAEALNNAGWSRYYLGDMVEAERLISRAFRLQPTVPQLRSNVGAIWAALGRVDEAELWLDEVIETNPGLTATRNWRVFVDLERGDPEGALERSLRYAEDEAPASAAHARVAFAALLARDLDLARDHARPIVVMASEADPFSLRRVETILGKALVVEGAVEGGARLARQAIETVSASVARGADGWDPPWELSAAYSVLGDDAEALRHLTEAVERGFPHATLLRLDPTFDPLRDEAEFDRLVRRVETRTENQRSESRGGS